MSARSNGTRFFSAPLVEHMPRQFFSASILVIVVMLAFVSCDGGSEGEADSGAAAETHDAPTDTGDLDSSGEAADDSQQETQETAETDVEVADAPECVPTGEQYNELDQPDAHCCAGLTATPALTEVSGECAAPRCPCFVCVNCGDGTCGPGENACNCPADCDGDCIEAGGEYNELDDPDARCCAGLVPVVAAVESDGECAYPNCPCIVCVDCGDGSCGPGENLCNCGRDCGGTCVAEGEQYSEFEDPGAFCCEGLVPRSPAGLVDGECVVLPCGCSVCVDCPNDVCGPGENECTCPEDCL